MRKPDAIALAAADFDPSYEQINCRFERRGLNSDGNWKVRIAREATAAKSRRKQSALEAPKP